MLDEHAHATVPVERTHDFETAFATHVHHLRDADGCERVEPVRSVDQPGGYLIRVAWRDLRDHVETFLYSAAVQEFAAGIGQFLTGDPVVVHFEAEPVTAIGHNTLGSPRWRRPRPRNARRARISTWRRSWQRAGPSCSTTARSV